MNKLWVWIGIILVIGFIINYWMLIVGAVALYYGIKKLVKYSKEKQQQKALIAEQQQIIENQSTISIKWKDC